MGGGTMISPFRMSKLLVMILIFSALVTSTHAQEPNPLTPLKPADGTAVLNQILAGKKFVPIHIGVVENIVRNATHNGYNRYVANDALLGLENRSYVISATCDVNNQWDHCELPADGIRDYPAVLEREKDGSFRIFIAVQTGLGSNKSKTSEWFVQGVSVFDSSK
jgi:hypothetical protein